MRMDKIRLEDVGGKICFVGLLCRSQKMRKINLTFFCKKKLLFVN